MTDFEKVVIGMRQDYSDLQDRIISRLESFVSSSSVNSKYLKAIHCT